MSRRKKVKVNFGNLFLLIAIIVILGGITYYLYDNLVSNDKNQEEQDKISNKELVDLGYSKKEIEVITDKLSEEDVLKIDKKYEFLSEFAKLKFFHIENMERYENLKSDSNYSNEDIIFRVNARLDIKGYTDVITVSNPDDALVIVNKHYAVPEGYEPSGLIDVGNGQRMKKDAGEALIKMINDVKDAGMYLQAQSGYRSISTQTRLYNSYVEQDGIEATDLVSAKPLHSEHHTGLAIDVSKDGTLEKYFEDTPEFAWLSENAHKYGFILRYPNDKIDITGYDYEPWHYRYVGVEAATLIHNEGITYEEYVVKYLGLY